MFDNVMLQITWRMAYLPLDLKTIKDTIINIIGNAICLTKSAPTGGKLTPYPADFILWCNVRCRFYVTAHAVQQSSDADFYPYTQSTASMILV